MANTLHLPKKINGPRNPKDYVIMWHWLRSTGSFQYYIDQQQQRAANDNAPLTAIYERVDSNNPGVRTHDWQTIDNMSEDHWFIQYLLMNNITISKE